MVRKSQSNTKGNCPKVQPMVIAPRDMTKIALYLDALRDMMLYHAKDTASQTAHKKLSRLVKRDLKHAPAHEVQTEWLVNCLNRALKSLSKDNREVILVLAMIHCKDMIGDLLERANARYQRQFVTRPQKSKKGSKRAK